MMRRTRRAGATSVLGAALGFFALAGTAGFAAGVTAPSDGTPDPARPAKYLFGDIHQPTDGDAVSYGFYTRGCITGAVALPINGPTWQVMRLSRNRFWGHPQLVRFIERLASAAPGVGWPGLLIGDMAQPRGGPMATGHASHQSGLDVDIWFTPMPDRRLSADERETMAPVNLVKDRFTLNEAAWSAEAARLLRLASEDPLVTRIFVNPTIKRKLCEIAGRDRAWLRKIRPWYGHDEHFHVRTACPAGSIGCKDQDPPPPGDGCDASLDYWFTAKPYQAIVPPKSVMREIMMADLPAACTAVLDRH